MLHRVNIVHDLTVTNTKCIFLFISAGVRYGTLRASVIRPLASLTVDPTKTKDYYDDDDFIINDKLYETSRVEELITTSDDSGDSVVEEGTAPTDDKKYVDSVQDILSVASVEEYIQTLLQDELRKGKRGEIEIDETIFTAVVKILTRSELRCSSLTRKLSKALHVAQELKVIVDTQNNVNSHKSDKIIVDDVAIDPQIIIMENNNLKAKNVEQQRIILALESDLASTTRKAQEKVQEMEVLRKLNEESKSLAEEARKTNIEHLKVKASLTQKCDEFKEQMLLQKQESQQQKRQLMQDQHNLIQKQYFEHNLSTEKLQVMIEKLKKETERHLQTEKKLQEELNNLTTEKDDYLKKIVKLKRELRDEQSSHEGKISRATATIKKQQHNLGQIERQLSVSEEENMGLKKKFEGISQKTSEIVSKRNIELNDNKKLTQQLYQKLQEMLSETSTKVSQKKCKNKRSVQEFHDLLSSLERKVDTLCGKANVQQEIHTQQLRSQQESLVSNFTRREQGLLHQQSVLQNQKDSYEKETIRQTEIIRTLQDTSQRHVREIEFLKEQLIAENVREQKDRSSLTTEISELNSALLNSKAQLADRTAAEKNLKMQLQDHKNQRLKEQEEFYDKINHINDKCRKAEGMLIQSQAKCKSLQNKISDITKEDSNKDLQIKDLQRHLITSEEKVLTSLSMQEEQRRHIKLLQDRECEFQASIEGQVKVNEELRLTLSAELSYCQHEVKEALKIIYEYKNMISSFMEGYRKDINEIQVYGNSVSYHNSLREKSIKSESHRFMWFTITSKIQQKELKRDFHRLFRFVILQQKEFAKFLNFESSILHFEEFYGTLLENDVISQFRQVMHDTIFNIENIRLDHRREISQIHSNLSHIKREKASRINVINKLLHHVNGQHIIHKWKLITGKLVSSNLTSKTRKWTNITKKLIMSAKNSSILARERDIFSSIIERVCGIKDSIAERDSDLSKSSEVSILQIKGMTVQLASIESIIEFLLQTFEKTLYDKDVILYRYEADRESMLKQLKKFENSQNLYMNQIKVYEKQIGRKDEETSKLKEMICSMEKRLGKEFHEVDIQLQLDSIILYYLKP